LRRQGKINEREQRTHPRRNALQQALGAGNQFIEPQLGSVDHRAGDRFLLCSDGLTDGLWDRQIAELLPAAPEEGGTPCSPAQRLVETAVEASGRDNTTAVVVDVLPPAGAP
jgi:protein phosphatase